MQAALRPGTAVASMKRTSPPTGGDREPVRDARADVRLRISSVEAARPRPSARTRRSSDRGGLPFPVGDLGGGLAADGGDLALEVADAGLARVLAR
mgnify:CR=1 FL=1